MLGTLFSFINEVPDVGAQKKKKRRITKWVISNELRTNLKDVSK